MSVSATERRIVGPSGRTLYPDDISLLIALEENGTIAWNDNEIEFNSGFLSHVYFRARNDLSHNIPLLMRVAERAKEYIEALPITHGPQKCLIGIPTAGTQFAQAIAELSYFEIRHNSELLKRLDSAICFSTMRSVLKKHGKDNMWVGKPELEKYTPITFENVVSTAKAMLEAFNHLEEDGYPAKEMNHVVFADWGLGGMEALALAGYPRVHTLYVMLDVIAAFVHVGLWKQARYKEMKERIRKWKVSDKNR